jgi:hypothetical protein
MANTSRLRDQLYMMQGSRCFYCDRPIAPVDRSLEHIISDSIGGHANDENAVVICREANHLLGDVSPKRKIMMIKAGGGKIECPRHAVCAKPVPAQDSAHGSKPGESIAAPLPTPKENSHKQPHIVSQYVNAQQEAKGGHQPNSNAKNGNNVVKVGGHSPNKTRKKARPHTKGAPAVH